MKELKEAKAGIFIAKEKNGKYGIIGQSKSNKSRI